MKNVARMDLRQVILALQEMGLEQTALYFWDFRGDESCTVDGVWIDANVVRKHIGDRHMRELECRCTTNIPL
jgi:hypothetical protein